MKKTPLGFSQYRVYLYKSKIKVYKGRVEIKRVSDRYHKTGKFYMQHDSGKRLYATEARLAFAVENDVDYTMLDRGVRVHGSVGSATIGRRLLKEKERIEFGKRRLAEFENTLNIMKRAFLLHDYTPILVFEKENRENVARKFCRMYDVKFSRAIDIFDEAKGLVLDRLSTFSFRKVQNIKSIYMSAMQTVYHKTYKKTKIYERICHTE